MRITTLRKYGTAALLTAALLGGCGSSGVKPANDLANTTPAQGTTSSGETTGVTTTDTGTSSNGSGTVTIDLGNAANEEPITISDAADLGFLADFIYDTGSKKEYTVTETITAKASSFDQMEEYDEAHAIILNLNGSGLDITTGAAASNEAKENYISETIVMDGNKICITRSGTYILRGSLSGGQICFRGSTEDKVQLVLDGVDLSCTSGAPICFESGDKALITLAPDSINHVSDGIDSQEKGCIFSKIDLTINGSGSLEVTGARNNGISCKDDLKILNGTITVQAGKNALKGNDSVVILGGTITLSSKDDGIQSDKKEDPEKGFVYLDGGTIDITADDDGVQAVTALVIKENTSINIRCYDKKLNCDGYVEAPQNP